MQNRHLLCSMVQPADQHLACDHWRPRMSEIRAPLKSLFHVFVAAVDLSNLQIGSITAPSPSESTERDGNFAATALHRHRLTASLTSRMTTAGGSTLRSICRPRSVIQMTPSTTVHPSRFADR